MPSDKLPNSAEADHDLLQQVKSFHYQPGYGPHKALEINAERGVVLVQGRVPTFYLRQIAVECINRVAGVTQVIDLIEVVDGPVQRQVNSNVEDEQDSSESSMRHRMDLQDMAQTGRDSLQTHARDRHQLSSARG